MWIPQTPCASIESGYGVVQFPRRLAGATIELTAYGIAAWLLDSPECRELSVQMESDTDSSALAVQHEGDAQAVDPNVFFGRVAYTYGTGIDRPLSLTRYANVARNRVTGSPTDRPPAI